MVEGGGNSSQANNRNTSKEAEQLLGLDAVAARAADQL